MGEFFQEREGTAAGFSLREKKQLLVETLFAQIMKQRRLLPLQPGEADFTAAVS